MSEISVAAVCIIIAVVIITITEFHLRYITPRRRSVAGNPLPSERPKKIDSQHQIIPPVYLNYIREHPERSTTLEPPNWSPKSSLEFMDQNSISTSILSFGYALIHDSALCQEINMYTYKLCLQYPTKFGFFATLPSINEASIPVVLSSLKFCFTNLNADGVTLFTSYEGNYLGEDLFRPLFEELNRLHAVILIHPIANSTTTMSPIEPSIPQMVDLAHEITRTAYSLIHSNIMSTYPNMKMILSHGGGTLSYISDNIENSVKNTVIDFRREARHFYATSMDHNSVEMETAKRFFGAERIMYGSNFPFARERSDFRRAEKLRGLMHESRTKNMEVMKETAMELFPRL
ncbi:hypothetical protein ACMFMF_006575 [Clarireedia jacksonii]